jgi:hypothetical protein
MTGRWALSKIKFLSPRTCPSDGTPRRGRQATILKGDTPPTPSVNRSDTEVQKVHDRDRLFQADERLEETSPRRHLRETRGLQGVMDLAGSLPPGG